jgi:hypothetical protein
MSAVVDCIRFYFALRRFRRALTQVRAEMTRLRYSI